MIGTSLAPDYTGVGRPLVDDLRASGITATVRPVTLTGGLQVTPNDAAGYNVPKRSLVAVLQLLLQSRRLTIARSLPDAAVLAKELTTFKVKVTTAGAETLEAWREQDHDDLVLALAFALWLAERGHQGGAVVGGERVGTPTSPPAVSASMPAQIGGALVRRMYLPVAGVLPHPRRNHP